MVIETCVLFCASLWLNANHVHACYAVPIRLNTPSDINCVRRENR